jgi:hypothetical protein
MMKPVRRPRSWLPWLGSALLASCVGLLGPLGVDGRAGAQTPNLSAACADWSQVESLEGQARKAAAAGDARQYGLWKDAARAAQRCEDGAGTAETRDWFAYVHAADSYMSLDGEAQILSDAPAILAELDRLGQTAQQSAVTRAALALRGDVAMAYRQTREIVSARATPVLTPTPTISPILLRGGDHARFGM